MSSPGRPADDAEGAELLARMCSGDRDSVGELYDRYGRRAYALARRILADEALAEDVVQEVFLSVWRNPGAFDPARAGVSGWLLAMVHHKAVDAVRREESQRRRQTAAGDDLLLRAPTRGGDIEEQVADGVVSDEVRRALGALPTPQREALALAYYGGYTQREVAALTGVPLGTVKTRMLAGIRRLRGTLAGTGGPARGDETRGAAPADGRRP